MTDEPTPSPTGTGETGVADTLARSPLAQAGGAPLKSSMAERTGLTRLNVALLAFGFGPLLAEFFANLWGRPHYQFFPLALAGAGFLAWSRLKELPRPLESGHAAVAAALMGASFCLLAAGMALWSPWLGSLAAVLGLAGVVWWIGGGKLLRAAVPALVLVLTIIPPPLALDTQLMLYLRGLAVRWSSRLLDTLGVIHFVSGNVIELPSRKLLIEEACSGINSVLFTWAACLFYLLWRRRSVRRILVCLPCALAGVLLGNVIRITLGAWLEFHQGIDILSGWRHELVGLVLVAMYLALIVSLDELLDFLTRPMWAQPAAPAAPAAAPAPVDMVRVRARLAPRWGQVAGFAFALLGVAELGRGWLHHYGPKAAHVIAAKSALRAGATFTMPEQIGNWKRLDSAVPGHKVETQGIFSQVWHYQKGQTVASVALDYPFRGYHDVTVCYTVAGWHITRQERQAGKATDSSMALMEVEMKKEPISHGWLWFSTVDEQGHWMETPVLERRFLGRWKVSGRVEPVSYRVQVLMTGYGPLPPAEREPARQLFEAARKLLVQQLFSQMQRKL